MPRTENAPDRKLCILHVLRAPVGGLFRHVVDLTREQIARGHAVGLVTDSLTGEERAVQILAELEPSLALGVWRFPMPRPPHILDFPTAIRVALHARALRADVVHGNGSKGGVYARLSAFLPGSGSPIRAYTPHGGSFHYRDLVQVAWPALFSILLQAFQIDIDHWRQIYLLFGMIWGFEAARLRWLERQRHVPGGPEPLRATDG